MKPYFQKLTLILITVIISLTLVVFYMVTRSFRSTELLVAWGWQGTGPNQACILQIINPKTQERSPIHTKTENCSYQVINFQGQPRLVGEQNNPRVIVIYAITSTGALVLEETISVEGIMKDHRPLYPQFVGADDIYFTGILNNATGVMQGREQLLQLNSRTGEVISFATYEYGMIDFPILSPNGTYLVYSAFPRLKTWRDCLSHCGSYYHLVNLETNTIIDLVSRVNHLAANPVFTHCNLHWSPNERFLAFNLGCESESPGYVVIYDIEASEVVTVIKPVEDALTFNASLVGWLSNDELVYAQSVRKESFTYRFQIFSIYSLSTSTSEELKTLPLTNSEGLGITVRDMNWTPDGKWLAAVVNGWGEGVAPLLTMDMGSEKVSYIALDTINERPLWSPSGDWIAYTSFSDIDAWSEVRNSIKITDRTGKVVLDTDVSNIRAALNYAWIRP